VRGAAQTGVDFSVCRIWPRPGPYRTKAERHVDPRANAHRRRARHWRRSRRSSRSSRPKNAARAPWEAGADNLLERAGDRRVKPRNTGGAALRERLRQLEGARSPPRRGHRANRIFRPLAGTRRRPRRKDRGRWVTPLRAQRRPPWAVHPALDWGSRLVGPFADLDFVTTRSSGAHGRSHGRF
jgi:hypothetical protein